MNLDKLQKRLQTATTVSRVVFEGIQAASNALAQEKARTVISDLEVPAPGRTD